ncbi:MAG: aldo/keto reductase, partial [Sphingobacteriales bacterium]
MMGRVLKQKNWERSSYVVSSKAYFGLKGNDNKPNQAGLSRKHLFEACHDALHRLQLDYLDLYFCHRPDPNVPMEEIVWTMNQLIQQGKILYWGTSEWSATAINEAHKVARDYHLIGPSMEQPQYNMFDREKLEKEFLPLFNTVGLGTTIFSPLASGFLTGKYLQGIPEGSRLSYETFGWLKDLWLQEEKIAKLKKLIKLAEELGVSLPSMAIAWTIANPHVTTAILGASKAEQLKENLKAMDVLPMLTPEILSQIEHILNNKPVVDIN